MHIIILPEKFYRANGEVFTKPVLDEKNRITYETDANNNPIVYNGQPQLKMEEASFMDVLRGFLNLVWGVLEREKAKDPSILLGNDQSAIITDIFRALNLDSTAKTEELRLEDRSYEWLESVMRVYGSDSALMGIDQAVMYEVIRTGAESVLAEGLLPSTRSATVHDMALIGQDLKRIRAEKRR